MLREARIVMPHLHTTLAQRVHDNMRLLLAKAFGGFTAFKGQGGWVSPDGRLVYDSVVIYDVAIDGERDSTYDTLAGIACDAGRELDQESVYVRYPNGNVDIIDLKMKVDRLGPDLGAEALAKDEKEGRLLDALLGDAISHGFAFAQLNEDGSITRIEPKDVAAHKPQPGQLWKTQGGGTAFVGRRATVVGGGWYATLVENIPGTGYRAGFEYTVDHEGELPGVKNSTLRLVELIN